MIKINLLPWREQARKKAQHRFLVIAGAFAGLGVFSTLFFHMHYSSAISHQLKRNTFLQQFLDQESNQLMTFNKQKKDLAEIDGQLHFIFHLRESSYRAVRLLNELVIVNPDSVTLYKIVRRGNTVLVFGRAKSNLQITLFMKNIEKSKFFNQPVLTDISGKDSSVGEDRNFQLKMEQQG